MGRFEIVDALIKAGAYVNSIEDRSYETPIYIAAKNENLQLVEHLLQVEGVEVNRENIYKKTE